jgi:hypothetical protein
VEVGPNKSLEQTGHATDGWARHGGFSRVSRMLGFAFGDLPTL